MVNSNVSPRTRVGTLVLLLACLSAPVFYFVGVFDQNSLSRRLQNEPMGFGDIFWSLVRRGCFLRGFFLEAQRYADLVRRDQYNSLKMKGEEVLSNMRINNEGPLATHGLFWLNIDGGMTEALSFAPTEEGGGLSLGTWSNNDKPHYRVRVLGDRNWAGAGYPPFIVRTGDPIVTFSIEEGSVDNPETVRITVDFLFPFTCTRFTSDGCLTTVLDWTMVLINTPDTVNDGRPSHARYPNSIVWQRDSDGVVSFQYEAIQVATGAGEPLSPAVDDFIKDVNEDSNGGSLVTSVLDPGGRATRVCSRSSWRQWSS